MTDRIPFSAVRPGDRITFDSGYHMTGVVVRLHGTHNGKKMITFQDDDRDREMLVSYAAHRSVIPHD